MMHRRALLLMAALVLAVAGGTVVSAPPPAASAHTMDLPAPTGLAAVVTGPRVALTWAAAVGAHGYDVYRDGRYVASTHALTWTSPAWSGTHRMQIVATATEQYSPKSAPVTVTLGGTTAPAPTPGTPKPTPTVTPIPSTTPTRTVTPSPTATYTPTPSPSTSSPSATPTSPPTSSSPPAVSGWKALWREDFNRPGPLGSFLEVYGDTMGAYPAGWKDTSGDGTYDPARTLSAADGAMDIWVHSEGGRPYVAAPQPKLFGPASKAGQGQTYGRYEIRYRVLSPAAGYKTAWLLWPDSGKWPDDGEIDFPEGSFNGTIKAYAHHASVSGGQDAFNSGVAQVSGWHTAVIEWTPGRIVFVLDGKTLGTSTRDVPSKPMHWVIQTETGLSTAPSATAESHVQVDYAAAWAYQP